MRSLLNQSDKGVVAAANPHSNSKGAPSLKAPISSLLDTMFPFATFLEFVPSFSLLILQHYRAWNASFGNHVIS